MILFNSLKVTGDVDRPVIVNLAITFAVAVPLGFVAVRYMDLGVAGLWYAYIIEEAFKATAMSLLWWRKKWVRFSVVRVESAQV